MKKSSPFRWPLGVWVLAMSIAFMLEVPEVSAQASMKRSAGSG